MDQISLDAMHRCPVCAGAGKRSDPETDELVTCKPCEGTGQVPFDPDDHSEIPY